MTTTQPSNQQHFREARVLAEIPSNVTPLYFPAAGCEAPLLVQFMPDGREPWVGAFGSGNLAQRALTGIFGTPSAQWVCVVSQGRAYWVDLADPSRTLTVVHELVHHAVWHEGAELVLLGDPWRVYACGAEGPRWTTERLGTEGLKFVSVDDDSIVVGVETPDDEVETVQLDIVTGRPSHRTSA
jgi:hypothetical protein